MPNTREKLIELFAVTSLEFDEAVTLADYLIANGVTVQEWIPVTERLPEYGSSVFTFYDDGRVGCCTYYGVFEKVFGVSFGKITLAEVTHWMPLPEHPKGE